MCLDDEQVYVERLCVALHRLELSVELYCKPDCSEDQARVIIQQVN